MPDNLQPSLRAGSAAGGRRGGPREGQKGSMSIPPGLAPMRPAAGARHTRHFSAQASTDKPGPYMDRRNSALGMHARKPADTTALSQAPTSDAISGVHQSEARAAHLAKTTQRRGQGGKMIDK